jgi:probable phosphoglycerate mutase
LSRSGREEAEVVRRRIGEHQFDAVWSSDLTRAVTFAELVVGEARIDHRLRELDFGSLEGMTWDECDPPTQRALAGFDGFAAPDGESVAELTARALEFITGLEEGRHLVFTHGGPIRLLTRYCGEPASPPPGSVTVLEWRTDQTEPIRGVSDP